MAAALDPEAGFDCVRPTEDPEALLVRLAVDMLEDVHLVGVVHQLD